MIQFRASMTGFEATPSIYPKYGAWGTTPTMTQVDLPLLSRCLAMEAGGRTLSWYSHDLTGLSCVATLQLRRCVADAVDVPVDQAIWSTSKLSREA